MAIISHKYRYIFLHSRKTAGSSVEVLLGRHCGPHDIIYPTSDGKPFGIVEKNNRKAIKDCHLSDIRRAMTFYKKKGKRLEFKKTFVQACRIIPAKHATAIDIRMAVSKDIWSSYFKFCYERNPFDRLVSFYHWRTHKLSQPPPFKEFAFAAISDDFEYQKKHNAANFSNRPFYLIDNQEVCDHILKFENLTIETQQICERLGVPFDELPKLKSSFRPKIPYKNYYSKSLIKAMEKTFEYELERFSYSF